MTNIYIRIMRDGKPQNIEVEQMTDEERALHFRERGHDEMLRYIDALCHTLKRYDDGYNGGKES